MKRYSIDQIPFFRFTNLPSNGHVTHAIFTRQGGYSPEPFDTLNLSISVPDRKSFVYQNRSKAYSTHSRSNENLVHAHLVHGADVGIVSSQDYGQYVGPVDGLITDDPNCGLTMNFADCSPIFLYDPINQAIGLGHAGWQGTVKDLAGSMVKAMQRAFRSKPNEILAAIGPSIGPCCYEVGEPVISAVNGSFSHAESLLIIPSDNREEAGKMQRPHFDLPEANLRRLKKAGVTQIEKSRLCTACRTDLFFSHRAEKGVTGRFGVLFIPGGG
jgi:YfiH family protein